MMGSIRLEGYSPGMRMREYKAKGSLEGYGAIGFIGWVDWLEEEGRKRKIEKRGDREEGRRGKIGKRQDKGDAVDGRKSCPPGFLAITRYHGH